jgi:hypothetical protein
MPAKGPSQNLEPEAYSLRHKRRVHLYQGQGGIADRRRVMYRAVCVALLGTAFMLMVQGDVLLTDSVTLPVLLKIGLTFVLLYNASTYSIVSLRRGLKIARGDEHD